MLNSKNALSQKYPQPQKEPCEKKNLVEFCKKKFKKKFPEKKIQKKIEERLPRFSRSLIGGGRVGCIYRRNGRCVFIRLHRHGDRHKDRETESRERKRKDTSYLPIVWSLSACWFTLVRFGWFGSVRFIHIFDLP